jgi:hypothetical protein
LCWTKIKNTFFAYTDVLRGKADVVAGFVFQCLPAVPKAQQVEAGDKVCNNSGLSPGAGIERDGFLFVQHKVG